MLELRTVVFDRADTVDDDVADEPAATALDHSVLDIDLASVAALDDGHHAGLVTDAALPAPAHHHAFDGAHRAGQPRHQATLEQLREHPRELVSLGRRPFIPFALEHGGGDAANIGDVGHEVLDAGDLFEGFGLDRGVIEYPVHPSEEVPEAIGRRAGEGAASGGRA